MSRTRTLPLPILFELLALALVGLLLVVGFVFLRPRSVVDWTETRAVVLESDDWGFCGFTPSLAHLEHIDLEAIGPGDFPPVYLHSTLESAADVVRMADLLEGYRGWDDQPAVIQPNYIMASMYYSSIGDAMTWRRFTLPQLPEPYARPGLWSAVSEAVRRGVWWPEYHGLWHYNPEERRSAVTRLPETERAAREGVLFFPGMSSSFELALGRDSALLAEELVDGFSVFKDMFGRRPYSVIAPDYAWDHSRERMWHDAGVGIIQAKREQRSLTKLGATIWDRLWKVGERSWRYLTERDLIYLDRNCTLEGAQTEDNVRHAEACLDCVRKAWRDGKPAIIGTHRVNYVHLDPESSLIGFETLARVLTNLDEDPAGRPIYLTDHEIAQLMRNGTSVRDTGEKVFVRNLSHSRRPLLLPATDSQRPRVMWLAPRTSMVIYLPNHTVD